MSYLPTAQTPAKHSKSRARPNLVGIDWLCHRSVSANLIDTSALNGGSPSKVEKLTKKLAREIVIPFH